MYTCFSELRSTIKQHENQRAVLTSVRRIRPLGRRPLTLVAAGALACVLLASVSTAQDRIDIGGETDVWGQNEDFHAVTAPYGGWGVTFGDQTLQRQEDADGVWWIQFGLSMDNYWGYPMYLPVKIMRESERIVVSDDAEIVKMTDTSSSIEYMILLTRSKVTNESFSRYSLYARDTADRWGFRKAAEGFVSGNAVQLY